MKLLNLEILENGTQPEERFFDNAKVKGLLEDLHNDEESTYEEKQTAFKEIIEVIEDQTARTQQNENGGLEFISYDEAGNLCTALVSYENDEPTKLDYQETAKDRATEKVTDATVEDNGTEIITTFTTH